ncbi:MAG: glycosyltransferase [Chitinivibrionia bacterium]|nr:glycosyltransferase [Chitinivibrionia bacterium]
MSRVCVIRRAYYPAESHVRRNVESLVAAGYSVDLVCLRNKGEPAFEAIDGVNVHRVPLGARRAGIVSYFFEYCAFFFLASATVAWLHARRRFAVVEADSMPDFLIFAGLIPRLTGSRLLLYLFESMPEIWAQKRDLPMTHRAIRFLKWHERVSCSFAHAVLCCHDLARDALIANRVAAGKITTILNVPDERMFHRYEDAPAARDGVFTLVQHGTITENYGIQVVLEALAVLDPAIRIHYDVSGDGEYRPALEALARTLNVQDRVTFHGFVSRERLLELLLQSTAGVVPMLFEYQSPNKLFEFVALGKPVIASDRKTFKQHFSDEEVSYFKTDDARDLARAIEEAVRHPEHLRARVERASRRYEDYRWANMRRRYLDVYGKLAAR